MKDQNPADRAGAEARLARLVMPTVAIGFAVGAAGGLIGLGGAELRLPYLVGVLLLAPHAAVPVNLAVSLITVLASLPVRLNGIESAALAPWLAPALAVAAGATTAAYVGVGWLRRIPGGALARTIGLLLVILGLILLTEAVFPLVPAGLLPAAPGVRLAVAGALGLVIGAISSLTRRCRRRGHPTPVIGFGVPIDVTGTLSLLISLPTIVVGMVRHGWAGAFADVSITRLVIVPLGLGAVPGAPLGGWLASAVSAPLIKIILGRLLIWSAWKVFGKHA